MPTEGARPARPIPAGSGHHSRCSAVLPHTDQRSAATGRALALTHRLLRRSSATTDRANVAPHSPFVEACRRPKLSGPGPAMGAKWGAIVGRHRAAHDPAEHSRLVDDQLYSDSQPRRAWLSISFASRGSRCPIAHDDQSGQSRVGSLRRSSPVITLSIMFSPNRTLAKITRSGEPNGEPPLTVFGQR
jgi:hypothetical protein